MNRLIRSLNVQGIENGNRIAIDPVTDFPIDYYLLAGMVEALACDLGQLFEPLRPVAVRLEDRFAHVLLDLALLRSNIPQLALPGFFTAGEAAAAMAWSGAQAAYLNTTIRTMLPRSVIPVAPPPRGTARLGFAREVSGGLKQTCCSAETLIENASALVRPARAGAFDRHLALLPAWRLLEIVAGFYATLLAGGTYVLAPASRLGLADQRRPDFTRLVAGIAEFRISSLVVDARLLSGLVTALERTPHPLPLLARLVVEGTVSRALLERALVLGLPVQRVDHLLQPSAVMVPASAG